jgi:protein-tyrosine phosphatase
VFKHILIVCTGNICRSPMADVMLRAQLPGRHVRSAGTGAHAGEPATDEAIAVMKAHGYDLSAHRGRQATQALLGSSDLILAMDQSHVDWINRRYPQLRGRVHKLLKWHDNRDVEDPYGMPQSYFEQTFVEIEMGIADWLPRIEQ